MTLDRSWKAPPIQGSTITRPQVVCCERSQQDSSHRDRAANRARRDAPRRASSPAQPRHLPSSFLSCCGPTTRRAVAVARTEPRRSSPNLAHVTRGKRRANVPRLTAANDDGQCVVFSLAKCARFVWLMYCSYRVQANDQVIVRHVARRLRNLPLPNSPFFLFHPRGSTPAQMRSGLRGGTRSSSRGIARPCAALPKPALARHIDVTDRREGG